MNWYKQSQKESIIEKVKNVLKKHPFTQQLAAYYHIPLSDIDEHLDIRIVELDGKYAEGNGKRIDIDKKLMDANFFTEHFHFVIHEFFHWLKRRAEARFYLNDPEEVQSFVLQILWQLIDGKDEKEIIGRVFPIIKAHYENEQKAEEVFKKMLNKSMELYKIYKETKILNF